MEVLSPQEAEVLNAKAQQLSARYALGRLLDEASSDGQRSGSAATVRTRETRWS